jgi:hypothetical protein
MRLLLRRTFRSSSLTRALQRQKTCRCKKRRKFTA